MLAITMTLMLLAPAAGKQESPPQDNIKTDTKAQESKPDPYARGARIALRELRGIRAELATAQLELGELNDPQKALQRCNEASARLAKIAQRGLDKDGRAERIDVAKSLLDLRAAAVRAGAQEDAAYEANWLKVAKLIQSTFWSDIDLQGSPIDGEILRQAREGNTRFVLQLGERAVTGLVAALADEDKDYSDPAKDPLFMLMEVAPQAADAYVGQRNAPGRPNVLWDVRFARAIQKANPFHDEATWAPKGALSGGTSLVEMLAHCDRLLDEPQLASQVFKTLTPVARNRQCTDSMLATIARYADRDEEWPSGVRGWLTRLSSLPPVRDVLLSALASNNQALVGQAAHALRCAPTNDGVYATILRGPIQQRRHGCDWIRSREVYLESEDRTQWWQVEYGSREAEFVDALLRDPEPSVRMETISDLSGSDFEGPEESVGGWAEFDISPVSFRRNLRPLPLSDETLQSLATDDSAEVRLYLAQSMGNLLTHRQILAVASIMQDDARPQIRGEVFRSMQYLDWSSRTEECIAVMDTLLQTEPDFDRFGIVRLRGSSDIPMVAALHSQAGLEAVTRWAIERDRADLTDFVASEGRRFRPQLEALPADLWAQFIAHVMDVRPARGVSYSFKTKLEVARLRSDSETRAAAVELAARESELSALARFGLLYATPVQESDQLVQAIVGLLKAKAWKPSLGSDSAPLAKDIGEILSECTPALRANVADRLVSDDGIKSEQISRAFHGITNLPLTAKVIAYAKARSHDLRHPGSLVTTVLRHMAAQPAVANIDWIKSVTAQDDFAAAGLYAIGKLRDPKLLGLISRIIEGPANVQHYEDAVRALSGYMSDDASLLLLMAARKTGDETLRKECLEQVERIAALQDAEARLATRRLSQSTREVTVSKLMELLTDSDDVVRIEAIKGLGTWEALEAMPELIGLLKDPNKDVSGAARAALTLLNKRD